jgi:uncharacterized protein
MKFPFRNKFDKKYPMFKKYFFALFVSLVATINVVAQNGIPERPNPPRLVNNLSKEMPEFISGPEADALETKLENFARETSNQIVIVIVDDLADFEPAEYAYELGDKWQVGQEKEDNGIVILIKPTGGKGERKYFIATGKGLDGAIPDATCRQIEEKELVPNFKEGNFYEGLDKTTNVLMSLAKGEYNSKTYGEKGKKFEIIKVIFVLIFIIVFVLIMFKSNKGGRGGRGMTMGSNAIWFGALGGFGGGGRSGGGFGGGSSGGFGGFGGGSFGGGGSGGSW